MYHFIHVLRGPRLCGHPRVPHDGADEEDVDVPQPELGVGHQLAAGLGRVVDAVDLEGAPDLNKKCYFRYIDLEVLEV